MSLEEFIMIIRAGEASGKIKTSKPLSDFDLMINFAIGKIGERKGYPCDIFLEEIHDECMKLGDYARYLILKEEVSE